MKTNQFICDICFRTINPDGLGWEYSPCNIKMIFSHPSSYTPEWQDVCIDCRKELMMTIIDKTKHMKKV